MSDTDGKSEVKDYLDHDHYWIRRKALKIFGGSFHVYDSKDNLVLFSSQKAFKLKEDIRVFSDESMSEERLIIKARSIIDFGAAYDVVDGASGEKLGAFRRKVGQVHCKQLPRHIGERLFGQPVHALHHHVLGENQRFLADAQDGRIVRQSAGRRVRRERAK